MVCTALLCIRMEGDAIDMMIAGIPIGSGVHTFWLGIRRPVREAVAILHLSPPFATTLCSLPLSPLSVAVMDFLKNLKISDDKHGKPHL